MGFRYIEKELSGKILIFAATLSIPNLGPSVGERTGRILVNGCHKTWVSGAEESTVSRDNLVRPPNTARSRRKANPQAHILHDQTDNIYRCMQNRYSQDTSVVTWWPVVSGTLTRETQEARVDQVFCFDMVVTTWAQELVKAPMKVYLKLVWFTVFKLRLDYIDF